MLNFLIPSVIRNKLEKSISTAETFIELGLIDKHLISESGERLTLLIDYFHLAAKENNLTQQELTEIIAERLGLPILTKLTIPSMNCFHRLSLVPEALKECAAIAQPMITAPSGLALAISDPKLIDINSFTADGIPVFFASPDEILAIWDLYFQSSDKSGTPSLAILPEAVSIISEMVEATVAEGGQEIFLGHQGPHLYEFIANGKRFQGEVSRNLVTHLTEVIPPHSPYFITSTAFEERRIGLAATTDCGRALFYISWQSFKDEYLSASTNPIPRHYSVGDHSTISAEKHCEIETFKGSVILGASTHILQSSFILSLTDFLVTIDLKLEKASSSNQVLEILTGKNNSSVLFVTAITKDDEEGFAILKECKRYGLLLPTLVAQIDFQHYASDLKHSALQCRIAATLQANSFVICNNNDYTPLFCWIKNISGDLP